MVKILMCEPTHFDVNYVINPWMQGNINAVDREEAYVQWNELANTISKFAEIITLPPILNLPDMVFTANAGAFINDVFYLSKFKHAERMPEEYYFRQWASKQYKVHEIKNDFEGAGDLLYSGIGDIHFMGYGHRTSLYTANELKDVSGATIHPLMLVDSRYYHLDTCFCPLPNGMLLVNLAAIDPYFYPVIDFVYEGKIIRADYEDSKLFCCNTVCIGDNLIMPKGVSDKLKKQLKLYNFNIHEVELNQFIKSGGAAKCLTLTLP